MDKNRPMRSDSQIKVSSTGPRMWMGIGAVALIVALGLLFIVPGADDSDDRSGIETTPAPNVTPK